MTLLIVVLPLRLTSAQLDLHRMLASWLDDPQQQQQQQQQPDSHSQQVCAFGSSEECPHDLQRLSTLRRTLADGLQEKDSYDEGVALLPTLHEYYACLLECESRGFPKWSISDADHDHDHDQDDTGKATSSSSSSPLQLEWESALSNDLQVYSNLTWERANLLWNLVTLEAYQASQQPQTTKIGWSKAAQHFQNAACLVQELQGLQMSEAQHEQDLVDFSRPFLSLWQALLVAQSQRCVYESLACAPRPRHLLLAKLAAAAVPLYNNCESLACGDKGNGNGNGNDAQGSSLLQDHVPSLASHWSDYVRAYGIWMSSQAEFHQACLHKEKKQYGDELARLDLACRFAHLACDFLESAPLIALQSLHPIVDDQYHRLQQRLHDAQQENDDTHKQAVPHRQEVPEIRGEKLVNVEQGLKDKFWMPLQEPMFTQVTTMSTATSTSMPMSLSLSMSSSPNSTDPNVRRYADLFVSEMDKLVFQMACVAEERTESARKALAVVNLPHSLTAYRQEQSGGGIPEDLWQRVQAMQRDRRIALLQQDLWGLRDVAEQARSTYARIHSQLDFDLESDRLFRDQTNSNSNNSHPGSSFEGHDAEEVQKTFRQSLANYDRLLVTAQEGDGVLLRRLEILDTNPKYKLLQFQKSQLDRLLPGANASSGPAIDTSRLSRLLVELSSLFHQREVLLNTIRQEVKSFDITLTLTQQVKIDPRAAHSHHADQEYRNALTYAQKSFDGIVYEMQNNIEQQTELVDTILQENESFMHARETSPSSSSQHTASADSCIVMIEDAMEEIEQLSKHLKEGKDFYDVVIPKLNKLKQQVGDVSARLTVERLEYDDKTNRNRQEEQDAKMARRISSSNNNTGGGGGRPSSSAASPRDDADDGRLSEQQQHQQMGAHTGTASSQQPGFAQIRHGEPQVRVDDEKVATLVAMEFDPAKVVAALAKYDNNMDGALNELLSGF